MEIQTVNQKAKPNKEPSTTSSKTPSTWKETYSDSAAFYREWILVFGNAISGLDGL